MANEWYKFEYPLLLLNTTHEECRDACSDAPNSKTGAPSSSKLGCGIGQDTYKRCRQVTYVLRKLVSWNCLVGNSRHCNREQKNVPGVVGDVSVGCKL